MASLLYNSLPHISEASQTASRFEDASPPELSQLIVKYGLQSHLDITLVHRHFDLEGDHEQLVELDGVTSVFRNGVPDCQIVDQYRLQLPSRYAIVPMTFIVRKNGLIAYEYSCGESEDTRDVNNIARSIDRTFIVHWVEILEHLDLMDKYGLAVSGGDRKRIFEEFYQDKRVMVNFDEETINTAELTAAITTAWHVTEEGEPPHGVKKCRHAGRELS
jgi:hypothetical protein